MYVNTCEHQKWPIFFIGAVCYVYGVKYVCFVSTEKKSAPVSEICFAVNANSTQDSLTAQYHVVGIIRRRLIFAVFAVA